MQPAVGRTPFRVRRSRSTRAHDCGSTIDLRTILLTGRLAAITGERKVAAEVGTREVSHLRSLYRSLASCPARQVEIMRRLWHRNIILLFEVLDDTSAESIGLVMEFCSGGCSMSYDEADRRFVSSATGGVLPEPLAADTSMGLLAGFYICGIGVSLTAILSPNLLLTEDGTIRIADFGCARCRARSCCDHRGANG